MNLDSKQGNVPFLSNGTRLPSRSIDVGDEALLSFRGEGFFAKIADSNDPTYIGIIVRSGLNPKDYPDLQVGYEIVFSRQNIYCIAKDGF